MITFQQEEKARQMGQLAEMFKYYNHFFPGTSHFNWLDIFIHSGWAMWILWHIQQLATSSFILQMREKDTAFRGLYTSTELSFCCE